MEVQRPSHYYSEVDICSDGSESPASFENTDLETRNPIVQINQNGDYLRVGNITDMDETVHIVEPDLPSQVDFEIEADETDGRLITAQPCCYGISRRFNSWLFPQNTPISLQLWRMENLALPISYLLVGTFQGLSSGVMTVFLLTMGATEAQQTTIKSLRSLPASFKVLFGFLSDTTPLFGYKRKVSTVSFRAIFIPTFQFQNRALCPCIFLAFIMLPTLQ